MADRQRGFENPVLSYPGSLIGECRSLREEGLAGAIYTQLSDIEEETNGLLTCDRKVCKLDIS